MKSKRIVGDKKTRNEKTRHVNKYYLKLSLIGTICLVALAYLLHNEIIINNNNNNNSSYEKIINSTQNLSFALKQAKEEMNINNFNKLIDYMMGVGMLLEDTLILNIEKNEKEEKGDTTVNNIAINQEIRNAALAYQSATSFALSILIPAISKKDLIENFLHLPLDNNNNNLKLQQLCWWYIAVISHALTSVLPEYFLALDDTNSHSETLISGLNILMQASSNNTPLLHLYSTSTFPLVNCFNNEVYTNRWIKFCNSTFLNFNSIELRRAGILEELIVLHPDFAPLRLHYIVALTLSQHSIKNNVIINLIHNEKAKLHTRHHVDSLHTVILELCEIYISNKVILKGKVMRNLQKFHNCSQLIRPFELEENNWKLLFRKQKRPDIMDYRQTKRFLKRMELLLEKDGDSLPISLRNCVEIE